jgi:hypothetical protein
MMRYSRVLALIAGFVLPILETTRRWHELGDFRRAPFWLDDWFIGLFLLYGAWRTRANNRSGRPALAAAWGFASGMAYLSFFGQLEDLSQVDPSGVASTTVVAIKGVMFAVALSALFAAVKAEE